MPPRNGRREEEPMAQEKDLYRILGVSRNASDDEIKSAYKKLVRQYHPDLNPGDDKAEEKFKEVAVAFEVLGDKKKRQLYDEFGMASLRPNFDEQQARAYQSWGGGGSPFGGMEFDMGNIFEQIFSGAGARGGGFGRSTPRPAKGQDIESTITVDFMEAVLGAKKEIRLNKPGGSSGGLSYQTETVTLEVNIPPGIKEGSRIRLSGQGAPGMRGGVAGDLFLIPKIRPHHLYTREDYNLKLDLPLTLHEAYSGTQVDIPTPTGTVSLKIPAGAQGGQKLRLRGKGVAAHRNREAGDLIVSLNIRMPEGDNPRIAELLEEIQSFYQEDVRKDFPSSLD